MDGNPRKNLIRPTVWGISARDVVKTTAKLSGVTYSELVGRTRSRRACAARHAAMWVMRHAVGMSYQDVGRAMHRDHSSVINGVQRCEGNPHTLSLAKDVRSEVEAMESKRVQW